MTAARPRDSDDRRGGDDLGPERDEDAGAGAGGELEEDLILDDLVGGDFSLPGDVPSTHLDDAAYDEYVRRDLDAEGRPREGPPVALWIAIVTLLVFAAAVLLFR